MRLIIIIGLSCVDYEADNNLLLDLAENLRN